jgi:hypothetical protein
VVKRREERGGEERRGIMWLLDGTNDLGKEGKVESLKDPVGSAQRAV